MKTVKEKAYRRDPVGKRDDARLLLYQATGLRQDEIAPVKWGELLNREVYELVAQVALQITGPPIVA